MELQENWETVQDWMLKKSAEFGFKTWAVTGPRFGPLAGHGAGLMIITPECLKHVLKDEFNTYEKSEPVNSLLREFLGDGIFTSDGERWKTHRKVASHMFSRRLLRNSSEIALTQALKLKVFLSRHAESRESVDIQKAFYAYTMDTFSYIAFGLDIDSLNETHSFAIAFDKIQCKSNDRMSHPLWKWCRFFQLTQDERDIRACQKELVAFTDWVIGQKRREIEGEELGPDLISRFISADPTTSNSELRDIVMNFIIAGRDTTAATLSWCMYEMLKRPEIMAEMTQELEKAEQVEGKPLMECGADRLFEIIEHELPFTKAVTNETLRLHPSVPKDVKFAVKPDTLPDGTKVEKGMAVFYLPYVMGRNPDIWPDPLAFKPGRWLTKEEQPESDSAAPGSTTNLYKPTRVSDFAFPTFNAGPRLCLGRPLAYVEIIMALLVILPAMKFSEACKNSDEYTQTIVPSLKHGLQVNVQLKH